MLNGNDKMMIKHVPNILTILRIIAIPFFVVSSMKGASVLALFIFIFACFTDYFDGKIARKYNIITDFGKLMDPLADKFLVISALVLLCIAPISYIHWSVIMIIFIREVAVTVLREKYKKNNVVLPADIWGKVKTITQMIGVIFALLFYAVVQNTMLCIESGFWCYFRFILDIELRVIFFMQIYFWIVAGLTVMSGINYFITKKSNQ